MEMHNKYLFGVVMSIIIGFVLGLQGLAAVTHSSGPDNTLTSNGGLIPPKPLTLNTVGYASKAVGGEVSVPNAGRIGPGYKIIGVLLDKPHLVTTVTGVTWRDWGITFIISDRPFVNGSSMRTNFTGHWIVVMESVSPGILNSHENAISYMVPQQICHSYNNGTRTCTDINSNRGQLSQIRSTWLVVNQGGYTNVDFTIDGVNRGIHIEGDFSYQQMLALADSMIP